MSRSPSTPKNGREPAPRQPPFRLWSMLEEQRRFRTQLPPRCLRRYCLALPAEPGDEVMRGRSHGGSHAATFVRRSSSAE